MPNWRLNPTTNPYPVTHPTLGLVYPGDVVASDESPGNAFIETTDPVFRLADEPVPVPPPAGDLGVGSEPEGVCSDVAVVPPPPPTPPPTAPSAPPPPPAVLTPSSVTEAPVVPPPAAPPATA